MTLLVVAAPLAAGPTAVLATESSPPGMATVPSGQVGDEIPDHAEERVPFDVDAAVAGLEGDTLAGDHADTLEVVVTTASGQYQPDSEFALEFSDSVAHEGRRVAVPAPVLEQALGFKPPMAYGQHSSGDRWQRPIRYEDGYAIWEVPEFSTNTVTYTSNVTITGSPAADGSQYTYNLTDADSVSDFSIDLTGHTATEWDNVTGTATATSVHSISVAGTTDPEGEGGGDPTLEVTAHKQTITSYSGTDDGGRVILSNTDTGTNKSGEARIDNPPDTIQALNLSVDTSNNVGPLTADIYIVEEEPDGVYSEGTLVKSGWDVAVSGGWANVSIDDYQPTGSTITVEFVPTGGDSLTNNIQLDYNVSSGTWNSFDGSTESKAMRVYAVAHPTNVSVTADDGTSHLFGDMSDGQTSSTSFAITTSATELDWTDTYSGEVDYTLHIKEQTETVDPSVEVNGNWANHSGTLADGSTTSLTTDTAWIQSGTNRVNVTVGDGTLSSDAPTPSVDLDYNHNATDNVSVSYTAEKWSEGYNVSRNYPSERQQASLTIPFEGTVVEIRNIEYKINDSGSWSDVASSDYSLSGTELTVDIDQIYGGSIPADTTVDIRTNGSKVSVNNGTITVLEPTTTGNSLDSKVRVDSWASDSYIAFEDSPDGNHIHYTYKESWSNPDEHVEFEASGSRHLHLPGAAAGAETRVSTIPVTVSVSSGDVIIEVDDPMSQEPKFHVRPGDTSGDTVSYTFEQASGGEDYVLYSTTHDLVRDSGTAQSPLTLEDDDSEETLQFQLDSDSSSSSGGGGGGVIIIGGGGSALNSVPAVLVAFVLVNVVVYYIDRRRQSVRIPVVGRRLPIPGQGGLLFVATFIASGLLVLDFLSEGRLAAAVARVIEDVGSAVGPLAGIVGVGLVAWYAYLRFIKGQTTTVVVEGEQR